jgi:hypothetical protein
MRKIALIACALFIAIGCGATELAPTAPPSGSATEVPTPRPPDLPLQTPPSIPGIPTDILNTVRTEAARLAGVSAEQVGVVAATAVTWSDGSLGCPLPDEMYTQALVRGYQIVVQAGDEQFDFRVDDEGGFRVCDEPTAPGGPADPASRGGDLPPDEY